MSDIAIQLENISKKYRLGLVGTGSLKDDITGWWYRMRGKPDPTLQVGAENKLDTIEDNWVWALNDINLKVNHGEVLGIIGKNGAGKSTLLKILSKVTGPTTGAIKIKGRIATLLEIGTGFHPELTGRENIFMNGAILGMPKSEIKRKFDEIVDFSGIAKYIDTPVKRYSSGMYVRLGFAVAAHLEPDILVVDEVLAVGDVEFQKKAIGKMKDVSKGQGRTVLFVSHNMGSVRQLCSRGILLDNGKAVFDGDVDSTITKYLNKNLKLVENKAKLEESQIKDIVEGIFDRQMPTLKVISIQIENEKNELTTSFDSNETIIIKILIRSFINLTNLRLRFEIVDEFNNTLLLSQVTDSLEFFRYIEDTKISKGLHEFICKIPPNVFSERKYFVTFHIFNIKIEHIVLNKALCFDVKFLPYNNIEDAADKEAFFRPQYEWSFNKI